MAEPRRLGQSEFVALMAMSFATIAFSLDAMLPALGVIARDLTPDAPNTAQMVVTSFVLGMGVGTLITGPLSDAFGRRPVLFWGAGLYILGAFLAWRAQSLEGMLAARVIQGLGAAGPRVVAMAMIRDLYQGRAMARIASFVMLIFTLVPAIAPTIGAGIIWAFGWREIFLSFIIFSVIATAWLALRQDETLAPEARRPFSLASLVGGVVEVLSHRHVVLTIAVQCLCFGVLFSVLATTQPIFEHRFAEADRFHLWFGLIAICSMAGSLLNARIVMQMGMRRVISATLLGQIAFSALMLGLSIWGGLGEGLIFALFIGWMVSLFAMAGLTIGNLNALAMEPMGHLAGTTASVAGSLSTVAAVIIAVPIGLLFDGTFTPLAAGSLICCVLAYAVLRQLDDRPAALAQAD